MEKERRTRTMKIKVVNRKDKRKRIIKTNRHIKKKIKQIKKIELTNIL